MPEGLSQEQSVELERLHGLVESGTYYELLSVAPNAPSKDIQKAYYGLTRVWHPDRFFRIELGDSSEKLQSVFAAITQGYRTLTNDTSRRRYDREIGNRLKATVEVPVENVSVHEVSIGAGGQRRRKREHAEAESPQGAPASSPDPSTVAQAAPEPERPQRDSQDVRKARKKRKRAQSMRSRAGNEMLQKLRERLKKARRYYIVAQKDYEEGRVVKAASAMHLAVQHDPKNEEYKELFARYQEESKDAQAAKFVVVAEQAESFHRIPEALQHYRKAVSYDPSDGKVFYRLGMLVQVHEGDHREALKLLRSAVEKSPDNIQYRMSLADLYYEMNMGLNARREYEAVLKLDPKHAAAAKGLKKAR